MCITLVQWPGLAEIPASIGSQDPYSPVGRLISGAYSDYDEYRWTCMHPGTQRVQDFLLNQVGWWWALARGIAKISMAVVSIEFWLLPLICFLANNTVVHHRWTWILNFARVVQTAKPEMDTGPQKYFSTFTPKQVFFLGLFHLRS